ncbi:hypothetical protein FO519_001468 [Halicephalobus sp. NKZ332]|nr:hypothetical protein FO519_001468 [Halicephalobus sp. NKZ332]
MTSHRQNGNNRASYQTSIQIGLQPDGSSRNTSEDDFEMIDKEEADNPPWLLNGEQVQRIELCDYLRNGIEKIHGKVTVTNYRLRFEPAEETPPDQVAFELPLGLINGIEKFGYSKVPVRSEDSYGIKVTCKNMRTIKFVYDRVRRNRKNLYDALVVNAFPNSNQKPFFATIYNEPFHVNGWNLYDPIREFSRMGVPNDLWAVSNMNEDYRFIPTYPKVLVFPREAVREGDEFFQKVAKFRSSGRIPALVWHNMDTTASITRSSQPMVGMTFKTCSDDKRFVQMVWKANRNHESRNLKIFDARPNTNAQANRLRGGGYETSYSNADLIFLNIHSIHAIRTSLKKLRSVCYPKGRDKSVVGAEGSRWMDHLQVIMDGAHQIVNEVHEMQNNVLVHCSDGWDRTSQLTSLSMLLLDPYYRTIEGFAILIEKEWLSFGHKFAIRFGHGVDDPKSDQRSPIFVQWVDCVWQYLCEFPTFFEFNINLLTTMLEEIYSCRFGTFLFNNEREREEQGLKSKTPSFWSYILDNKDFFKNKNFKQNNGPIITSTPLQCKFWYEYYCQFNMEGVEANPSNSKASKRTPTRPAPPPPIPNGEKVTRV